MGRMSTKGNGTVKTLTDLAKVMGVSRSTVHEWRADGLEPEPDGRYSVDKGRQFHAARQMRAGLRGGTNGAQLTNAIDSKERKLKADADMAEHNLAIAQGKVVPREVVSKEWRRGVVTVKSRLLGLGRELAPVLTGRGPHEIKTIIDKRVFEILRLLAHQEFAPETEE